MNSVYAKTALHVQRPADKDIETKTRPFLRAPRDGERGRGPAPPRTGDCWL